MLTDVQIAQNASMLPIKDVAGQIGLSEDDLELYGKYKAKISLDHKSMSHRISSTIAALAITL